MGDSVLFVRGSQGEVHALHNVCRHRGSRLTDEERGRFRGCIQCPYHAWTYALDGSLMSAPTMVGTPDFIPADHGLRAVATTTWDGFVFASLAQEPMPFAHELGGLFGRFDRFNLPALIAARRLEYLVGANWKIIVQNYSECMHCPPVHPELARLTPSDSGRNDLISGTVLGGYMEMARPGEALTVSGRMCSRPVGDLAPEDMSRVWYYAVFPNMLLSLHPDYVMVHTLWPLAPDRTHVVCEWLFHPDACASPEFDPDDGVSFWDRTNRQDWRVCELTQKGVSSSGYVPGPYGPGESLCAAFDREVRSALGGTV
jgi:Rieske 2Fe-2S family protein